MNFCGNCGKSLVEQEKTGERKIITVLFADIAGFTSISETMDPEMIQDLLNTVFENMSNSIRKYGGTVHKYIGDEIMALFGAPIAYENHAERAGRAAIEIERSIEDITEKIHLPLNLHIALHSGEVVLGKVGSGDVQDYTVIGDTVNVASRLENIAPENNILVSKEFYERTKHTFQFEPFGETEVKGKAKHITCYLLKTVRTQREKIRGIKELESPLLGRDREINFLLDKLEETKKEKSMHLLILKGQPGIGKSRLFHEFEEQINAEETLLFETRSLPFGQEELHPFKQFVRSITSITTDMDEDEAKKSIINSFNNLLGTVDLGVLDLIDIILDFTSIKEANLEPKRKHQIVYYMIENLLRKLSEKKTLAIGFEDFHWVDSSSLLVLRHLINFLQDTPVLFILITRPLLQDDPVSDFLSVFHDKPFSSSLELKPLAEDVSLKLIATLLSIDKIPMQVKEKIVKKGEGNPLFIEELLKALMERKLITKKGVNWIAEEDIDVKYIPDTINEIVISRVDLLANIEKNILQYASVIGRIFWDKPIQEIFKQTMIQELASLSTKGFVQQRVESLFEDAKEYIFNHILIQESIYSSILKRVRKKLHRQFAIWLEESYPQMTTTIANLLAFHYEQGDEWNKAGYYYLLSGKESAKNYNNDEAISRFKRAITILASHEEGSKYSFDLYLSLGQVLTRIGKNEEAKENLELAFKYASTEKAKFSTLKSLANLYQKMSLYERAREKLSQARQYVPKKNSKEMVSLIFEEIWVDYLTGNIREAFRLLDDFETIFDFIKDKLELEERENMQTSSYSKRALLLNYTGDLQKSLEYYSKVLEIETKNNSHGGLAAVYNNMAGVYQSQGKCSKAIKMYEKSQELDKKMGNRLGTAIGCNNLAEMYTFLNDLKKAEEYLNEYLSISKKIHNKLGFGFAYINFGVIYLRKGDNNKALNYYNDAVNIFEELKSTSMLMETYDQLSWLYFEIKNVKKATEYTEKINQYLEHTENLELQASVKRLKGNIKIEQGDYENAEQMLLETFRIYEKMSNTEGLISLYSDFITLFMKKGDESKITKYKKKGKQIVEGILEDIDSERIRYSFLKKKEIRQILYP